MKNNLQKILQVLNIVVIVGAGIGYWTTENSRNAVQDEQIKDLSEKLNDFTTSINQRLDKSDEKIDAIFEQRH